MSRRPFIELLLLMGFVALCVACNGPASTTTVPATPTGLVVEDPTTTTLSLTWNGTNGATKYELFRATSASGPFSKPIYAGQTNGFEDTALIPDTTYFYEVQASDESTKSPRSALASGTTLSVRISGTVQLDTGSGLSGATLSSGAATVTTDSAGKYSIGGLTNGTYTVTPSLSGYAFSPASQSVTVSGSDVSGVDFTATEVYSISGMVTGEGAGFVVSDGKESATTDASGNYIIAGLPNGSYVLTPSHPGYLTTFNPANATVTIAGADVTGINFTVTSDLKQGTS